MKFNLFDIKRYAINDGPGIRTTIFFSGCSLRCVWCHNPESWDYRQHKTYKQGRCIGCGSCVEACPQGAIELTANGIRPVVGVECERCGHCTDACPTKALEMCGRAWTMDELMAEIEKERDIMEDSGGGVTLSGGEPFFQFKAMTEILEELGRRGVHRTVDTSLYTTPANVRKVANLCELFLVDLKLMDPAQHQRLTGIPNRLILDNIRLLAEIGSPFYIRIPLIEGVNATEENMEATIAFLDSLPRHEALQGINLLPYHDMGRDKHRRLWTTYNPDNIPMVTPSEEVQQRCVTLFSTHGYVATIGG